MPDDSLHLGNDRADVLGAIRDLNVEELFHRAHKGIIVEHRTDVIQSVRMRNDLLIGQGLAQLLHTAMKVADVRCGLYDPLAFQLQDYAQDPVSSRMLRSHIEQQLGFAADRLARFADSLRLQ